MATTRDRHDDRRSRPDRRVRRVSLHHPERRSGFDRRADGGTLKVAYLRALAGYRDSPVAVAVALLAFVALSAVDLLLTLRALEAGATELNPVMAALFDVGPLAAAVFKLSIAAIVAAVMWRARRYRRVLEVSLFSVVVMTALLGYHLSMVR